jgi:hypothetical protein
MNNHSSSMPLTLTQQDIYFDQLHYPDCPLYNVGGYIRLPHIDVGKLNIAHRYVVSEHDAFGIRLASHNGKMVQYLVEKRSTALSFIDLSQQAQAEEASGWLKRLFDTPIKIEDNELFQAYLLKINDDNFYYVGLTHHIAMDGWGFANWAEALGQAYRGQQDQKQIISWQQIVAADQTYLSSAKYLKDENYWQGQYQDVPAKFLPALYRENYAAGAVIPGKRNTFILHREMHQQFSDAAHQLAVPLAQLYLALTILYWLSLP